MLSDKAFGPCKQIPPLVKFSLLFVLLLNQNVVLLDVFYCEFGWHRGRKHALIC